MKALTSRNVDAKLARALERETQRRGISLNQAMPDLLREALGKICFDTWAHSHFMVFATAVVMAACSGTETEGNGGSGGGGSGGGEGGSGGSATTTATTTGNGIAGPGCPDLRGTFQCPLTGDPPEYTLTVTQIFDGEATAYQFHYSHNNMTATFAASADGITTSTHVQKCAPYMGVPALIIFPQSAPDTVTYNFINAGDDYQADIAGGASVICVRSQ